MLPRTLEPEVMDTVTDAVDYNAMDHSQVNAVFVDDFVQALWSTPRPRDFVWEVFDAGTGTALIPIELLQRGVRVQVLAADAAEQMLRLARQNVFAAGLQDAIHPVLRDCKALSEADGQFDAVMSNSIVHHIPEPLTVLRECWRILRAGGLLFVRDLCRPVNSEAVEHIVATYAGRDNPHQQQLFRESLHAALTLSEMQSLVESLGIAATSVKMTSDRHWTLVVVKS